MLCEEVGPWLIETLALSCLPRIGMANGCACRLVGGGLMILLSGISGLGIFGRWRLPLMLGTL